MSRLTLFMDPDLSDELDREAAIDGIPAHYEAMNIMKAWFKEHAAELAVRDGLLALSRV